MHYYRLYYLDQDDQHIIDVHDFEAATDIAAIVKAGALPAGISRELWNRGRRVLELVR